MSLASVHLDHQGSYNAVPVYYLPSCSAVAVDSLSHGLPGVTRLVPHCLAQMRLLHWRLMLQWLFAMGALNIPCFFLRLNNMNLGVDVSLSSPPSSLLLFVGGDF